MALPTNTFRPQRYFRSKFREGKYLLAAEATDVQLEMHDLIREFIKHSYGDMAVQSSWKADQISGTLLRIRPGEAWHDGIPFVMDSAQDPKVYQGVLETGVSFSETGATTSDVGGKDLDLSGLADGDYSIVVEAMEELVRPVGTGAVDPYLQGANVGEETANKLRMVYKIHVVPTADLVDTPTYPLAITNHLVNEIVVTPSPTENFLVAAIDISQDPNGADRRITLDNSADNLPFSVDAEPFINGRFIDSDGNEYHITSITTTDGGATVQILLDREVAVGSSSPKAGLPVITNGLPYKLVKRDFYVSASTGTPLGHHYYRTTDFSMLGGSLDSLSDLRTVTGVNTFGVDHNVRLVGGGIISWNATLGELTYDDDFEVTIPGVVGKAIIPSPPGTVTLASDGDVAFFYLDRDATSDYNNTLTVLPKEDVPANVDVYVLAERRSDRIYFPHGGSIGNAETGILGAFGGTVDKDLSEDLIIDALTENAMDEVFAETFNTQSSVDLTKTVGMTFEPFSKQYRASGGARFVDYPADTLPAADPNDPWTKQGTQVESLGAGILTLIDSSIGDRIAYSRVESSLVPTAHFDGSIRCRMPSSTGSKPMALEVKDGASGKHFGVEVTATAANLIDGSGAVLQTFAVDGTTYHTYRLVKIGNLVVQWYVDDILRGAYSYADITTGSGGDSEVIWGTSITATATVDVDAVEFRIYTSILQSIDVFRTAGLFYGADLEPDDGGLGAEAWTKTLVGAVSTSVADGYLNIVDSSNIARVAYERTESSLKYFGNAEIEMRVKIKPGHTNFANFGLRFRDGRKDISLLVRDDAGTLKAGLYNGSALTLVSTEAEVPEDEFVVLKLIKTRNETVQFLINGQYQDQNAYEEFTDPSSERKYLFGSFDVSSEYDVDIDYVQYGLPGQGEMAATPVRDFLTIVNSTDTFPIAWVSTDEGKTWHEAPPGESVSVNNLEVVGANILVRVGLSTVNAVLTDYGILYNKTAFDVQGQFEYDKQTATAGQTVFSLPFTFVTGVNELVVHYRPLATGETRKLTLPEDYTEANESQIELTFAAAAGDILEFRNQFTKDPLIPPSVRFLEHNHDGSRSESEVLEPTDVLASRDITVGRYLSVVDDVTIGPDGSLTLGDGSVVATQEFLIDVAAGGVPQVRLKRDTNEWSMFVDSSGEIRLNSSSGERMYMPQSSDVYFYSQAPDLTELVHVISTDVGGTGDAGLHLGVNNDANSWEIVVDNSDDDDLKFSYDGDTKEILFSDGKPVATSPGRRGVARSNSFNAVFSTTGFVVEASSSITLVTTGSPVMIVLTPSAGASAAGVRLRSGGVSAAQGEMRVMRGGTEVGQHEIRYSSDTDLDWFEVPAGQVWIDYPPAGTYTYTLEGRRFNADYLEVSNCRLVAYEL